ncbi:Sensor histidine kinase [Shewanella piezotolerans WP3]|uniref:histidine kinase n=1 Tax=Shewanella piezotolerans (strain WP3 / JCM 13877) TaxID=225849 RepID=B8CSP6_SHEPW|nr:HAMP domain-containing sensor histidine kinase [Shewanella piezotolerans]ACJ30672.1 Sensor histidine kinase [Shewanella piezotolerans WP3]
MAKYLPPLFTRLYLSLLTAIFASILLTFYLSEQFLQRSDVVDFYEDSLQVFIDVSSYLQRNGQTAEQLFKDDTVLDPEFEILWQKNWDANADCEHCKFLSVIANTAIYQLSDEQLLAVYPLQQSEEVILISDKPANSSIFSGDRRQQNSSLITLFRNDPSEFIPYLLLLIVIISLGTTLYFSVRRLQKQINQLVKVNQEFGRGELSARAQKNYTEPVNELAQSFNRMADAITETVSENQIFAQAVPHEMRTPLSRIQLATGLLRQRKLKCEELVLLDNIDDYIDDIEKLTRQVLTFSKLNSISNQCDHQAKQCIKLDDFLQGRIKRLVVDNNLSINLNLQALQLECDPAYLRLIFDNLIKNALQYAATHIEVNLKVSPKNLIMLTVDDDGPGIDNLQFETIFQPFSRLDKSRNQETGGLGLGLPIAKAATRRINGHLFVSHSHLGGARFSCQLPLKVP